MCHTWMLHIRLGNNNQPNEEKKAKKTGRGISFVITLWVCCSSAHCSNKCGHDIGIHFFSLSLFWMALRCQYGIRWIFYCSMVWEAWSGMDCICVLLSSLTLVCEAKACARVCESVRLYSDTIHRAQRWWPCFCIGLNEKGKRNSI